MNEESEDKQIVLAGACSGSTRVRLQSHDPQSLESVAAGDGGAAVTLEAELFLPEGAAGEGAGGNRVGVVVVQGLGGVKPERELTYGQKLAKAGHVALVVDSFGSRGLAETPDDLRALRIASWAILADAFAGLRFLAGHPAVNNDAICVMGFSWGGMVSVLTAYEQIRADYLADDAKDERLRFAGHVGYYGCSIPRLEDPTTTGAPLLVMVGARDRNVSVERTRQICADLRRGGSDVSLEIFDAYHQWDGKDLERRHNVGALADLHMTISRDHEVREERWNLEVDGLLARALLLLRDLDWEGYDMLRDPELHARSDRLLFGFLERVAERAGAERGDRSAVPLGQIGRPPE